MKTVRMVNRTRKTVIGSKVAVADRWWSRLRGYLGRPEPRDGEGILIVPCSAIHMFGMRFPLDVVFLSRDGLVVHTEPELRPWTFTPRIPRARYVLEVRSGTISGTGTRVGDTLTWIPAREPATTPWAPGASRA